MSSTGRCFISGWLAVQHGRPAAQEGGDNPRRQLATGERGVAATTGGLAGIDRPARTFVDQAEVRGFPDSQRASVSLGVAVQPTNPGRRVRQAFGHLSPGEQAGLDHGENDYGQGGLKPSHAESGGAPLGLLVLQRVRRVVGGDAVDRAVGEPANLCVVDPAARWTVDPTQSASRSRNTPFAGRELPGRVVATFLRGLPTVLDGRPVTRAR